jgi:hypothetical protein
MINRMLPSLLAVMALLLGYTGSGRPQEGAVSTVVDFHVRAAFEGFRGVYQADERERQHPEGWRYLEPDVLGAVQALEAALGFRADHVYSAALRGFAARLTAPQIGALATHPFVA